MTAQTTTQRTAAHRRRMAEKMERYEAALRDIHRDAYALGGLWASAKAFEALKSDNPTP